MIENVILHLQTGKEIVKGVPYHLTPVAGVPFICRTLLSLQKLGVENFFIIQGCQDPTLEHEMTNDRRITRKIQWIYEKNTIFSALQNEQIEGKILFLQDTVLCDPQKLKIAVTAQMKRSETISMLAKEGVFLASDISHLRSLEEKPFTEEEGSGENIVIETIADRASVKRAEKKILQSLNSPTYGLLEKYIDRKLSILLTSLLIRTSLTPNQITIISTLIGLSSLYFFISPHKIDTIIGSFLFIVCIITDCCDGEVARVKFQESKYGSLLDMICDNVVQIPLFFAIAYGVYQSHHQLTILSIGFMAVIGSFFSFLLIFYSMWLAEKVAKEPSSHSLSPIEKREYNLGEYLNNFINRDFGYLILICAVFSKLEWFLIATAVGTNLLWIAVLIKKRKPFFSATTMRHGFTNNNEKV